MDSHDYASKHIEQWYENNLDNVKHLIRFVNDPEHPLTLEQLNVVEEKNITVNDDENYLKILFTPTIPHCSMVTLIGLSLRVLLLRSLPTRYKVRYRFYLRHETSSM